MDRLWADGAQKLLIAMGLALWRDRVRNADCPAMAGGEVLLGMTTLTASDLGIVQDQFGFSVLQRRGIHVARLHEAGSPALPATVIDNVPVLGRLPAQKLLRFLVHRGWEQRFIEAKPRYEVIEIEHGWRGLAHLVGVATGKQADQVRRAVEVLRFTHVRTPLGEGGLMNYWFEPPAPGRGALLKITLIGPLEPGFVSRIKTGEPCGRWLVPFPSKLPPLIGRPREHSALCNLQLRTLLHMRRNASELAATDSVRIAHADWAQLTDEAGVPRRIADQTLDVWCAGNGSPAFLRRVGPERFTLAAAYKPELTMLRKAGEREVKGRLSGLKSAAARAGRTDS
jgi:hypothetical protein